MLALCLILFRLHEWWLRTFVLQYLPLKALSRSLAVLVNCPHGNLASLGQAYVQVVSFAFCREEVVESKISP